MSEKLDEAQEKAWLQFESAAESAAEKDERTGNRVIGGLAAAMSAVFFLAAAAVLLWS